MSKQYVTFHVSWRDAKHSPIGLVANERDYGRAAAAALQSRLNMLAEEGWIVQEVIANPGMTVKQTAAFTIVAFR